ncbi:MAG: hypothetical protein IT262_00825 [Saprospiraceae bacterium]|nr:hypothetical protein [Saprospiraceae bacterium]
MRQAMFFYVNRFGDESRSAAVIFIEMFAMVCVEVQRTGNIILLVRRTSFFLFCYWLQILPPRCGFHTQKRLILKNL